eukprot:404783_1
MTLCKSKGILFGLIILLCQTCVKSTFDKQLPRNKHNERRPQNYDIYDMLAENDDLTQHKGHKYPPHYFSRKYFPSFSAMLMDDDMDDTDDEIGEKYSHRKQITAFLLALFLGGWGVGRFYVGSYVAATFKLLLYLLITGFRCLPFCGFCVMSIDNIGFYCANCFLSLGFIAWIITDLVLFGTNSIRDEDGLRLKPW